MLIKFEKTIHKFMCNQRVLFKSFEQKWYFQIPSYFWNLETKQEIRVHTVYVLFNARNTTNETAQTHTPWAFILFTSLKTSDGFSMPLLTPPAPCSYIHNSFIALILKAFELFYDLLPTSLFSVRTSNHQECYSTRRHLDSH